MTTINEDLLTLMDSAITAAEVWTGQKAKRMTLVTERGDPINYQFGVGFEIAPGQTELTPTFITTAIETAMKQVGAFINANCREHFVRAAPEITHETSFDTKVKEWRGHMRGSMIGAAPAAGPAKVNKEKDRRIPGFAEL